MPVILSVFLLALALQTPPQADMPQDLRVAGRVYSILIPYGWKISDNRTGQITLEHVSGATISYNHLGRRDEDLQKIAEAGVDRVMRPLGFAGFGDPLARKLNGLPAIQYPIHGNRLSQRRKLLYIAFQQDDGFSEI